MDSDTETQEIPALGHDWGEWTVTAATCEEKGVKTRICANDASHSETQEIPALGHAWGEWTVTTPATCEDTGEETRVCKHDTTHKETREIEALGHAWGEWTVTTPATCEDTGEEIRVCNNDAIHTETREIAALDHDMGEWTGDPVQERVCKRDGTYTEYRLNPAIKFASTVGNNSQYTLGSQKTLGLTIDRIDREDENVYAYFNNGGQVVVTGSNDYSKTLTADDFDAENGSLKITLKAAYLEGLAPGTYSLTASFKVADGYDPIVSEPVSFTIVKPSGGSSSPATGESNMMTTVTMALMLIATYGAAYALTRRKTEQA